MIFGRFVLIFSFYDKFHYVTIIGSPRDWIPQWDSGRSPSFFGSDSLISSLFHILRVRCYKTSSVGRPVSPLGQICSISWSRRGEEEDQQSDSSHCKVEFIHEMAIHRGGSTSLWGFTHMMLLLPYLLLTWPGHTTSWQRAEFVWMFFLLWTNSLREYVNQSK